MKRLVLIGLAGMASLFVSPSAWAGQPQERHGFWIGLGGGYGSADATCDGCEGDREGSATGFVKLGGTLNERVLLGAEANVWVKEEDDVTLTLGAFTGTLTFYPRASSGFFLKGGVGVSYVDTDFELGSVSVTVSKTGWGVLAGIGYDVRLWRNISLTPCVNFHYGQPGDISVEGETLRSWKQNVVSLELGITFH